MNNLRTESVNERLQAALEYASQGWAVIPVHVAARSPETGVVACSCGSGNCAAPGKHPVPTNGLHGCSTNEAVIRQWWADMPLANVAVVCGEVSGIAVLDIDPRNGGIESINKLPKGPQSLYAKTGGDGMHVFFKYKSGVSYPKYIGPGLDIRSDGSYIVAPPSVHISGKKYSWGNTEDIADFDWLGEQIKKAAGSNGHSAPTSASEQYQKADVDYAEHVLELAVASVQLSDKGTRNETLNRESYSLGGLVGAGLLGRALVREKLYRAALAAGLDKGEIERTLNRALKDGIDKPRAVETLESLQQMYLAKRICEEYGELTVFDLGVQEYWQYDDSRGVWAVCNDYQADHSLMRMHGMPAVGDKGPTRLNVTYNLVKNVSELVKRILGKEKFFDGKGVVGVPFKNGVVGHDGAITPHSPDNRFTHGFDFDYVPGAKCPIWLKSLKRILPDEGSRDVIQEMFGATMFRLTSRYQRGFILYGTGANGKSLVCKVLQGLMPDDTVVSVAPHNFRLPFHLGKLRNAWLNVVTEIYRTELKETETFKAVLSGDLITAEEKFKPAFNFRPRVACVFAANTLPVVTDQTEGLWRKLTVVPFGVEIPVEEQDDMLDVKLLKMEREGICAWGVAGALRLIRNGKFTSPAASERLKKEWRTESDQVQIFLRDACTVAADIGSDCASASDLYSHYRGWALQNGHSALSSTNFGKRLKNLKGIKSKRLKRGQVYNLYCKSTHS